MTAIPTVTIWKGDKHCIVNAVDLPAWKANGWSEKKDTAAKVEAKKAEKSK